MKKIFLFLFSITVMLFQSCDENSLTPPVEPDDVYRGKLTVGDYINNTVGISVSESSDSTVLIFFDNVKFAKAMPVYIDITLKDVPCSNNNGVLNFYVENIDPYLNKEIEPSSKYRFAIVTGTIIGNELLLSARMSDDLAPSRAGKEFSFRGVRGFVE
ncbi:MAG: hypothetical protein J6U58_01280 [Bacteroidaceae bacterium]|nr:hypothetical protein [Bacteroidaceae bacterium]